MERKTLMSASRNIWKSGKLPVTGILEKERAPIKTAFFNTAADGPGMQRVTTLPRGGTHDCPRPDGVFDSNRERQRKKIR
jgi:hypothetical protein